MEAGTGLGSELGNKVSFQLLMDSHPALRNSDCSHVGAGQASWTRGAEKVHPLCPYEGLSMSELREPSS